MIFSFKWHYSTWHDFRNSKLHSSQQKASMLSVAEYNLTNTCTDGIIDLALVNTMQNLHNRTAHILLIWLSKLQVHSWGGELTNHTYMLWGVWVITIHPYTLYEGCRVITIHISKQDKKKNKIKESYYYSSLHFIWGV